MILSAKASPTATLWVEYFEQLQHIDELEVSVVQMNAYYKVLSRPWVAARNPEMVWSKSQLSDLRLSNGLQWEEIPKSDRISPQTVHGDNSRDDEPTSDIQLLVATSLGHL
jgi:hypothetical protein